MLSTAYDQMVQKEHRERQERKAETTDCKTNGATY